MDPVSAIGIAAAAVGLGNITVGLNSLISARGDAPQGIAELVREHGLMRACLAQFRTFAEQNERHQSISPDVRDETNTAISETRTILQELHQKLWSANDAAKLRAQLSGLQFTLEEYLLALHQQHTIRLLSLDDEYHLPGAADDGSDSEISLDSESKPPVPTAAPADKSVSSITILVPKASQNLTNGLVRGRATGPKGEALARQLCTVQSLRAEPFAPAVELVSSLVSETTSTAGLHTVEGAKALFALAKAYEEAEDYDAALGYFHDALMIREQVLGAGHASTLAVVDAIAAALELLELWDDALAYWVVGLERRAAPSAKSKFGPSHPTTLATRFRVARAKGRAGKMEDAVKELGELEGVYAGMARGGGIDVIRVRSEKAVLQGGEEGRNALEGLVDECEGVAASREANFGPSDRRSREATEVLRGLRQDLARLRSSEGAPLEVSAETSTSAVSAAATEDSAETGPAIEGGTDDSVEVRRYQEQVREAREKKGYLHPDTLDLIACLAKAYGANEKHELAIGWFQEAIKGREKVFGERHPSVASLRFDMAMAYIKLDDYQTALLHLRRTLSDREASLALNHPAISATQMAIGCVHASDIFQQYQEAVDMLKQAVHGYNANLGSKHDSTLEAQFHLAKAYGSLGMHQEGIDLHEQVVAAREKLRGPTHQKTLASKFSLAIAYGNAGRHDEAIPLFEDVVHGRQETYGRFYSGTTRAAQQLALCFWNTRRWAEAIPYFRMTLEAMQKNQSESPTEVADMLANIATCHALLKQFPEAAEGLRRCLEIHKAHSEPASSKRVEATEQLAKVCELMENNAESIELYQVVISARQKTVPDTDPRMSYVLDQISRLTWLVDQREACIAWTERLLAIPEDAAGVEITLEQRLIARRRIALIHFRNKQSCEAIDLYQALLEEAQAALPRGHWLVQRVAEELSASHHLSLEQSAAVADLHARREQIKKLLDVHPSMAIALLKRIADIHLAEHEYSEAIALYEEVLNLIKDFEALPEEARLAVVLTEELDLVKVKHTAMSSLADAHLSLANYEKALQLSTAVADNTGGGPLCTTALYRVAAVYERMGSYAAALATWERVLAVFSAAALSGDAEARMNKLRITKRIALVKRMMGDLSGALESGERALSGFRASRKSPAARAADKDGERDEAQVEILKTLEFLAGLKLALGSFEDAIAHQEEAARGFQAELGPDAEESLAAMLQLAEILAELERQEQAVVWYEKALVGYQNKVGEKYQHGQDQELRRVEDLGKRLGVSKRTLKAEGH
ncbi:hypothetical protein QBC34DRAFT_499857 [Podospora aff. communis PSN243]|uniref:TPR-like protein n=1 Tax=Podospora aff. communis PSN243 TaxID=3040156 RepID=A0AAV9G0V6_9PEZI|nr:hypothetical protein QBC34DRAFT_499857 [Podospora aff. communis PSN243]